MTGMEINRPDIHAEVTAAVMRYENALTGNEVAVLDALFWSSTHTIRYGPSETLYGQDEILAFRKARSRKGQRHLVVTTFGTDFATANLEFERAGEPSIGRQSQSWVRFPEGWQVVSAHVSSMPRRRAGVHDSGTSHEVTSASYPVVADRGRR